MNLITSSAVRFGAAAIAIAILALVALSACVAPVRADEPVVSTADSGSVSELCPFSPGWNLVVLSGTPDALPSCVVVVWHYDGVSERWFFWGRNSPAYWNDLASFDITKGYWVWAQQ